MGEEHLTYFKVENFKRFESLELTDLGQFNLIVGDNNVGKTSVLEALMIDKDVSKFVNQLGNVLYDIKNVEKTQEPFLWYFANRSGLKNEDGTLFSLEFRFNNGFRQRAGFFPQDNIISRALVSLNGNDLKSNTVGPLNIEGGSYQRLSELPLIPFGFYFNNSLVKFYGKRIQTNRDLKKIFIKQLAALIPNIEDIEVTADPSNSILIAQKNNSTLIPLSLFGDGAIKLFRLLIQMPEFAGKRLMIDEIDAGLHHLRFKSFWKAMLLAAKEYDVQIFATTHNQECIDYLREVLEEVEMEKFRDKTRLISLIEMPDQSVKAYPYHFEDMEYAAEIHRDLRGGAAV